MPKESRNNAERWGGKYILLTYAQAPDHFDWNHIASTALAEKATVRIGRETHQDGGTHYHAFFQFNKRFQTRNSRHFDIQGCHPNITIVRYHPHKAWDYVGKEGDVVHETCQRPSETAANKAAPNKWVWDTIASADTLDDFKDRFLSLAPKEYITAFGNVMNYANATFGDNGPPDYVSPQFMMSESVPKELQIWTDGFKAGLTANADDAGDDRKFTCKERLAIHSMVYLNA